MKNWKTSLVGFFTGVSILIPSVIIPILNKSMESISIEGICAGLGAIGIGWFAGDKQGESAAVSDEDYNKWLKK